MPIEIRQVRPEDAPAIQLIYSPIVANTAISFEEIPPTIEKMRQRIVTTLQNYPYLVAERAGRLVGYAYASQHRARAACRWTVDVTVYIAEGEQRRAGVGRSLNAARLPILAKQGFNAAYAGIALPNAGSVGRHEWLGFRHIGTLPQVGFKLGQWHDVGYWRLELGTPSNSPSDPCRYPEITR
ncbi:arsinothricin resistance N-acetyltransferase ArsN1 family B [Pseudomonas sp. NPDC086581]|uniref:arsinothricin resistance N-acetyltransferase ArsN1 family B n=1 Tax=Pseudomonas sp. NPDC086581 TaxID=3364432 RepID=UPI00382E7DC5